MLAELTKRGNAVVLINHDTIHVVDAHSSIAILGAFPAILYHLPTLESVRNTMDIRTSDSKARHACDGSEST